MKFIKIVFAVVVSLGLMSSSVANAQTTVYVPTIIDSKVPFGTMEAAAHKKLSDRKVKKVISQQEIDAMMQNEVTSQQSVAPEGFGIVWTTLANQTRSTSFCTASPTVYNQGSDYIIDFWGTVDIYRETGLNTGQYDYVITANASDQYIPPTVTTGFRINTLEYAHWGYRMFWQFNSTYQVQGSGTLTVKPAYANF